MKFTSLVLSALACAAAARGAEPAAGAIEVVSGVTYEPIGVWDVARLNAILTTHAPAYFGVTGATAPAANAVRLYRVT